MTIYIHANKIIARDLQPGNLFSTRGKSYWGEFDSFRSVGEAVYIRTARPADDFPDADSTVYLITIRDYPQDKQDNT